MRRGICVTVPAHSWLGNPQFSRPLRQLRATHSGYSFFTTLNNPNLTLMDKSLCLATTTVLEDDSWGLSGHCYNLLNVDVHHLSTVVKVSVVGRSRWKRNFGNSGHRRSRQAYCWFYT